MLAITGMQAATSTIYTKVNGTPKNGWEGTYIIVFENSASQAYVWDGTDDDNNFVTASIQDGIISSENLKDYQITVSKESTKTYYVKTSEGRISCGAKKNEIIISGNGSECTIADNGGFTMLETNTGTCRFLYNKRTNANRFRFYYDKDKKWTDTDLKNICFYALGEIELGEPQNLLDINYAQADMYACPSKFPTQNNPYSQYFYTNLRLMQKEAEDAVPYVDLEIYAPTQYSIEGTYKTDQVNNPTASTNLKYWINCQAGAKHSSFTFPSKEGGTQAAINAATMTIAKKGESSQSGAYIYHIKLTLTDSNKKIWTLDKDLDVYAQWIDCDRSGNKETDMAPVPFVLESGNHGSSTSMDPVKEKNPQSSKLILNGQLYIQFNGKTYDIQGQETTL